MTADRVCPPGHVEYPSEMVANNAVTLHMFVHPGCTKIEAFECGDHWHIGHHSPLDKANCPQQCRPQFGS